MKTITTLLVPSLCFSSVFVFGKQKVQHPNIIIITTDQQSFDMIHALGNQYIRTPNMDRLVNRGVSFTNTYCANPLSVPSRFAMLTGASPAQYGIRGNEEPGNKSIVELLPTQSMGAVFRKGGYDTYYGGKVHLPYAHGKLKFGGIEGYQFDFITDNDRDSLGKVGASFIRQRESQKPFLLFLSFLNPHDICFEQSSDKTMKSQRPRDLEKYRVIMEMNEKFDSIDQEAYYRDEASRLPLNYSRALNMPDNAKTKLGYREYSDEYWKKYRWIYNRLVELVDAEIGQVLDALGESELKENTLVVFTSDHGEMAGSHQLTTKSHPFEECQKVPFVFAGAGVRKSIQDSTIVCNGWDLLPTVCDLANIEKPKGLSGVSLAPRVLKNKSIAKRKVMYLEGTSFTQVIKDARYKFTRYSTKGKPEILFDLQADPGELKNVRNEPNYQAIATELSQLLDSEMNKRGVRAELPLVVKKKQN